MSRGEPQEAFVVHALGQGGQQAVVVDPIEETFEVDVHDPGVALADVLLGSPDGLVGVAARPEAIAVVRKRGLPERAQDLSDRLLDDAIEDRRNTQRADSAVGLRDLNAPHRRGAVAAVQELAPDPVTVAAKKTRELGDGHAVDPRCSTVRHHATHGPLPVLWFADLLHPFRSIQALVLMTRRGRSPLSSARDFECTRGLVREVQLSLDWLRPSVSEIHDLLTFPFTPRSAEGTVRAFGCLHTVRALC